MNKYPPSAQSKTRDQPIHY